MILVELNLTYKHKKINKCTDAKFSYFTPHVLHAQHKWHTAYYTGFKYTEKLSCKGGDS